MGTFMHIFQPLNRVAVAIVIVVVDIKRRLMQMSQIFPTFHLIFASFGSIVMLFVLD